MEERRSIVASVDQVAIDSYAGATYFGLTADDMPWLALAERYGLGTVAYESLPFKEVRA